MRINPVLNDRVTLVAEGQVGRPALSGDGSTVVFHDVIDDSAEMMRHRDGVAERLTTDRYPDAFPSVSRDGETVVWSRFSSENPQDPAGHYDVVRWQAGQMEYVANTASNELNPTVSADGRVVSFEDDGDGRFLNWNIHRWEDGRREPVTTGDANSQFPVMSADGSRIVFRRDQALWLRDHRGVVKPFLETPGGITNPCLNGDGTLVLYTDHSKPDEDLYLHHEPTNATELVAGEREVDETWATMSADGRTIAWTGFDRRKGNPADTNIYVKRDDRKFQITFDDGGLNAMPKLSEDGNTLAWYWVDQDDTNHRKIFKVDLRALFD